MTPTGLDEFVLTESSLLTGISHSTKNLTSRPKEYFPNDSFKELMTEILDEQNRNECAMYIVYNEKSDMIGRVNLTSNSKGKTRKAEIGYRIGEEENVMQINGKLVNGYLWERI